MCSTIKIINFGGLVAAVALLASCSSGGPVVAPVADDSHVVAPSSHSTRQPAWMRFAESVPDAKAAVVYVALTTDEVLEYGRRKGTDRAPLCQFAAAGQVNGLAVDPAGNLWVPVHTGSINAIQEYGPNCGAAGTALVDPGIPEGIAFDAKGTAYVANIVDAGSEPGQVEVYAKGSTSPTGALGDPSVTETLGVAIDASGDVFASVVTTNSVYAVMEFPGGAMPGKLLNLSGFKEGASLAVDGAANLLVDDIGRPSAIDVYAPPYQGAPTRVIPLNGESEYCVLGQHMKRIFCGDLGPPGVDVYGYPKGKYLYSYTNGISQLIIGIATYPLP